LATDYNRRLKRGKRVFYPQEYTRRGLWQAKCVRIEFYSGGNFALAVQPS
jgi:hypothetical protein